MKTVKPLFTFLFALAISIQLTAQNVGIGTVTPSEKLEVIGNVKISSLVSPETRLVYSTPSGVLTALPAGSVGEVLTISPIGAPSWAIANSSSGWQLNGNAGTNSSTNFIGTTDNQDFILRSNNLKVMKLNTLKQVVIGDNNGYSDSKVSIYSGNVSSGFNVGMTLHMNSSSGNTSRVLMRKYFSTSTAFTQEVTGDNNRFIGLGNATFTGYKK